MKELTRLVFAKPFGFGKKSLSPLPDRSRPSQAISPDDRQFVTFAVTGHSDFVLSNLDGKDVDMLVDAMESFEVSSGDNVIEQGDMGDFLYVVKEGSLRCRKDGAEIGIIGPGEVFGELALLYDCPRSASVVADSDCMLFRVSREIFRRIQATFILANDDTTRRFLKRTELLGDLPDDVIREMANCLFKKEFQKGDMLAKKGDYFGEVYFLKQGRLLARNMSLEESEFADEELKVGDCFGERAIVMKQPSIANVECLTDGVAFVLTKERFLHCLQGMDLEDIIEKEVDAKVMRGMSFFVNSDISRLELLEMAKKLKPISREPGDFLATIGEAVEPALYFIASKKSKEAASVEITCSDGVVTRLGPSEPFGFGKDTVIISNLHDNDSAAAALYGKEHKLVKLDTEEGIDSAKRNFLENSVVISQSTVKVIGTDTVDLRKLNLGDLKDIIYDPLRLGKIYEAKGSESITHATLEKQLLLGQGTFGQVWLCRDPSHDAPYALKIQYKRELIERGQTSGVIRETRVMRKMHHPFVMGLVHAEQDPRCLYMMMGLVQGGELRQQMRNETRPNLSEPAAKFYAACMLEGLSYMHRREYIYRDLKGENVLLDKDGYCVIVDLGFAKHVPDKTFTFCGTPVFIAPEVLLNKGHNKSADIWSFGIMIYEMLFGTNPFFDYDDPTIDQRTLFKRIVKADFQPLRKQSALDAYAETSVNAKDLILKLLTVKPKKRIGCMAKADLDIRNHPWFRDIDFGKLYRKELTAPWVPNISDPFDGTNFMAIRAETKIGLKELDEMEQDQFKDFC